MTVQLKVCPGLLVHEDTIGLDLDAARVSMRAGQTLQHMSEVPTAEGSPLPVILI